jgi:hypothetical protein
VYCYDTDDLLERYYDLYSDDLESGIKHFCHENRSEMFPLFFDLDILTHDELPEETLKTWAEEIQKIVRGFLSASMKSNCDVAIVATSETVQKEDKWKTGMHIHFPDVICDMKWAVEITGAVIHRFGEKFGQPEELVHPWYPKVLDLQPLERGLRMIGSRKAEPCKTCSGGPKKRGNDNPQCLNPQCVRGRVDIGRPYWPRWIIGSTASTWAQVMSDVRATIKSCSVRLPLKDHFPATDLRTKCFVRPRWWKANMLPGIIGDELYEKHFKSGDGRRKRKRDAPTITDPSDDGSTMHGLLANAQDDQEFVKMDENDPKFLRIAEFFEGTKLSPQKRRKTFHILRDGKVTGVSRNASSTVFFVWTSSRECRNLLPKNDGSRRIHSSRTVWIKVTRQGIQWNCHCKCDTTDNRIDGIPCSKPSKWSRSSVEEYQQLTHLPIELSGLFFNEWGLVQRVQELQRLNDAGTNKSSIADRLTILKPFVELCEKEHDAGRVQVRNNLEF